MDILILRPLIFALVEYSLACYVFKKGTFIPKIIGLFLIFLGTYQAGEFLFLATGDRYWNSISLFATTMLPPFGVVIAERLSGKKAYANLFFSISLILGLAFVFYPGLVPPAEECNCFVKYQSSALSGNTAQLFTFWSQYYVVTLGLTMAFMAYNLWHRFGDMVHTRLLLIGYFLFFPSSYLVVNFFNAEGSMIASVMCSLAFTMAFITTYISIRKRDGVENFNMDSDALIATKV